MDRRSFVRMAARHAGRNFDQVGHVSGVAYHVLYDQGSGDRFRAKVCVAPDKASDTTTFHAGEISAANMTPAKDGRLETTLGSFTLSVAQNGSDFRVNGKQPQPRFVD